MFHPRPHVLITGDFAHADFEGIVRWLHELTTVQIGEPAQDGEHYDLAIIFQSRPGQTSQAEVEALHRRTPLSPMHAILGSWCEGETRSGRAWHGVERVFWYEAVPRLTHSLMLTSGRATSLRTETPAERWNRQLGSVPAASSAGRALVVAHAREAFEAISDGCRLLGYTTSWRRVGSELPNAAAELVIWDADEATDRWLDDYLLCRRSWRESHFVVLLNFPRLGAIRRLYSLACHSVLGKPFSVLDFAASIAKRLPTVDRIVSDAA